MFDDIIKAFEQLGDAKSRSYIWISLLLSFVGGAFIIWLSWFLVGFLVDMEGGVGNWLGVVDNILALGAPLLVFFLLIFTFPALMIAIGVLFAEQIADRVDVHYYPDLEEPRKIGIAEQSWLVVRFFFYFAVLNIIALPLYLIPVIGQIAYLYINAWLTGREYFEMVAPRRMRNREMSDEWKRDRFGYVLGGLQIFFLLLVPFVNLTVPVVGTAYMVHRVERRG